MSVAKLAARALIGGLMVGHGTQKLKGWFGGPGLEGTDGMMQALNMHPPRRNSIAAGTVETAGGAALALGLATPLAAAALIGNMVVAIRKVHLANGPWAANGGWEYNAVLIAAVTALAETGPGELSLDHLLGIERSGPAWALAALATGVGTAFLTMAVGRRGTPSLPPATDTSAATAAQGDVAGDPTTAGS
jgi:putative oxidoreductase